MADRLSSAHLRPLASFAVPTISQQEALKRLAPHCDALFQIVTNPWNEYHALMPREFLIAFGPKSRANNIHDLMLRDAGRYASKAEGNVRMFQRQLMKGIVIDDIALRLKKLNEDSLSRGHYTKQVEEFREQKQLDGIDATHHLELGYVLNEDETEQAEVRLACPSGKGVAWWSRIDRSGIQPVVLDLFPADGDPSADGGAIIKPKERAVVVPMRRKSDES